MRRGKTLKILFLLSILGAVQPNEIGVVVQGSFTITDKYPGGFTARLEFPVTRNYLFGWLLNVTSDIPITDFKVYEGEVIGVHPNNKFFIVRHQEHNLNLHRDASGRKVFYCQGKCEGRPNADVRFIPLKSLQENIGEALERAEQSGVTGEYPETRAPSTTTTTLSFLEGWTPPVFEPIIFDQVTQPAISTTAAYTTPPLNLAVLNLRYNLRDVITKSLLFIEAQRSGALPDSNRIPWRSHSALSDGSDRGLDLSGGYYIDGGFVKYSFPMAFSTTLIAWGVLEFRNAYLASHLIPHVMNAIKWSTDYFLKCHVSPFVLYGQVSTSAIDDAYWGRPEDYKRQRPSFKIDRHHPGSDLAAEVAAAMAATAMVFKKTNSTYSSKLIIHAKQLYRFATRYLGNYSDSIKEAAPAYRSWNGYFDELAWAGIWIYKATGLTSYLEDARKRLASNPDKSEMNSFYWDDKRAGSIVLLAQITRDVTYLDQIRRFCNRMQTGRGTAYTPRGLAFIDKDGPLRLAANSGIVCLHAANLGIHTDIYRRFGHGQLSYILGDGGRSYVVGFGKNSPTQPQHRASSCPDLPAPCTWKDKASKGPNPQVLTGAMVGGPDKWDQFEDDRNDYVRNKVGLDYNAALQTLAAGILELQVTGQTFSEPNPKELNAAVSETFSVRHDYGEVMRLSLLFYEAQRAGELPNNNRVPWRKSAFENDVGPNGEDLSGGYFNGGDYVKFNFPMAYSTTVLAWGLIQYNKAYQHVGELQRCMDALKWATDYFIKCHVSDDVLYAQVGSGRIDHGYWLTPDEMKLVPRPAFNLTSSRPGSELVAETAAAMAATSMVFRESNPQYAATLLEHAKQLYEFAHSHKERYHRFIHDAARFYRSISGYEDELVWAGLWLYSATGEQKYLNFAELNYRRYNLTSKTPLSFYWDDKTAGVQLLLAQLTRKEEYVADLQKFCDRFLPENGFRTSSCPTPPEKCGFEYLKSGNRNPHVLSGALVGGPNAKDKFEDDRNNHISNDVAIDYNAAFQSAIAALKYLELYPPITTTTPPSTVSSTTNKKFDDETTFSFEKEIDLSDIFDFESNMFNLGTTASLTTLPRLVGNVVGGATTLPPTTITTTTPEPTTEPPTTEPTTLETTLPQTFHPETTSEFQTEMPSTLANTSEHAAADVTDSAETSTSVFMETSSVAMENTTITIATTRIPSVIRVIIPRKKNEYPIEVIYLSECRPIDVFDLCSIEKHLFKQHKASEKYHCRFEAFKDCADKQGVACDGKVWNSFPFWNTRVADDVTYFSDDEQQCKDPKLVSIENCKVRGIIDALSDCFVTPTSTKITVNGIDITDCRWLVFRQCVKKITGHCPNTWSIWEHWNFGREPPYFNNTELSCGAGGARSVKISLFLLITSLFVSRFLT